MENQFYELYNTFDKQELFDVIIHAADYQPEAVECAMQVMREKRWSNDYSELLQAQSEQLKEKEQEEQQDILLKAEFYRKEVEIKMQNNGYSIRGTEDGMLARFIEALADKDIEYFQESEYSVLKFNPSNEYYFKNEDVAEVDALCKELGIDAYVSKNFSWYTLVVAVVTDPQKRLSSLVTRTTIGKTGLYKVIIFIKYLLLSFLGSEW